MRLTAWRRRTKPLPTDLAILEVIYDRYYDAFAQYAPRDRAAKNYVRIDIPTIATHFNVDPDIVFGRLYYHLHQKSTGVENLTVLRFPFSRSRSNTVRTSLTFH